MPKDEYGGNDRGSTPWKDAALEAAGAPLGSERAPAQYSEADGINFAVFTENTASNFAVPVRYGITLLQRVGWKLPEGIDGDPNENSNGTPAGARSSTTTSKAAR